MVTLEVEVNYKSGYDSWGIGQECVSTFSCEIEDEAYEQIINLIDGTDVDIATLEMAAKNEKGNSIAEMIEKLKADILTLKINKGSQANARVVSFSPQKD